MISSRKNSSQVRGARLVSFLLFGFLSILLLFSNNSSFNRKLSLKLYVLLVVVNDAVYGNITNIYRHTLTSQSTIKNLEAQVKEFNLVENNNILLRIENNRLKEELVVFNKTVGFASNYFNDRKYYFAPIYLKSINALHQNLVVKLGSKDGVLETSLAIAENGVIGYVHKVYENYLEILPVTANEAKIPAVSDKTKINGIVQGNGSLTPIFKSYEDTVNLIEGETIYTSGIGGVFDKYVPIGKLIYQDRIWKVELFSSILSTRDIIIINKNIKSKK